MRVAPDILKTVSTFCLFLTFNNRVKRLAERNGFQTSLFAPGLDFFPEYGMHDYGLRSGRIDSKTLLEFFKPVGK